jgi:GTP-binding protein EngB required for normal cell division
MGGCLENYTHKDSHPLNIVDQKEKGVNKSLKTEGKIRIYFYGDYFISKIINQTSIQEETKTEGKYTYYQATNNALNWEYFRFDNITEDNNVCISQKIKNDFEMRDFYDIIIVTVDELLDKSSQMFFKHFEKFSEQKSMQPFILFLTKKEENPDITKLYQFITNEYLDKRTLYALKYPELNNEEETKLILEQICKFRNYFHEEGDSYETFNDELSSDYKFNILLCGRAGTGKSTFINKFLENKKAKEGEGLSVTHKIISYSSSKYPINISDTPGFEDENTVKNVIKLLDDYNTKLIDARKKINLIIYFFPYSDRSVLNIEYELLQKLNKYNSEIIFVINFVKDPIEKRHYKRIYQIYYDSLEKLFPKDFKIKIYPINLYSQIDDDDSDEVKIIKEIGLDELYKGIYEDFSKSIIELEDIKKIKSVESLFDLLGNNKLFNHFKAINDIFISLRSELSNLILSYGRLNRLSIFNKEKNMKKMADLIYIRCIGKKCEKIEEYLNQLSLEEKVEEKFDEFNKNLDILRSYKKSIHSMYFYKAIHDHKTLALGYLCLNDLEKLFETNPNIFVENDKINSDLIINLCTSMEKAIKGFDSLSKKYKQYYEEEDNSNKNKINELKKNKKKEEDISEMNELKENILDVNEKPKEE